MPIVAVALRLRFWLAPRGDEATPSQAVCRASCLPAFGVGIQGIADRGDGPRGVEVSGDGPAQRFGTGVRIVEAKAFQRRCLRAADGDLHQHHAVPPPLAERCLRLTCQGAVVI